MINDRRTRGRRISRDIYIIRVIILFLNFFFFFSLVCSFVVLGAMQNGRFDNLSWMLLIRARERDDSFLLFPFCEKYDARARARMMLRRQRRMFED